MNKKIFNKCIISISIIIIIIFVVSSLMPLFYKYDIETQNANLKYANISKEHIFGNDYLGRDMFIRICYAIKNTIIIALFSILTSLCIGVIYGSFLGYVNERKAKVLTSILNVLESVPEFLLAIMLMILFNNVGWNSFEGNFLGVFVTIALVSWIPIARIVGSQTRKILNNDFISYSKLKGAKFWHIFKFHILPNVKSLIIMVTVQRISSAIFLESFLSFIGLGVQPPTPSIGRMINEGIKTIRLYPHLLFIPATCLFVIILLFNIIGEVLSNNFNGEQNE